MLSAFLKGPQSFEETLNRIRTIIAEIESSLHNEVKDQDLRNDINAHLTKLTQSCDNFEVSLNNYKLTREQVQLSTFTHANQVLQNVKAEVKALKKAQKNLINRTSQGSTELYKRLEGIMNGATYVNSLSLSDSVRPYASTSALVGGSQAMQPVHHDSHRQPVAAQEYNAQWVSPPHGLANPQLSAPPGGNHPYAHNRRPSVSQPQVNYYPPTTAHQPYTMPPPPQQAQYPPGQGYVPSDQPYPSDGQRSVRSNSSGLSYLSQVPTAGHGHGHGSSGGSQGNYSGEGRSSIGSAQGPGGSSQNIPPPGMMPPIFSETPFGASSSSFGHHFNNSGSSHQPASSLSSRGISIDTGSASSRGSSGHWGGAGRPPVYVGSAQGHAQHSGSSGHHGSYAQVDSPRVSIGSGASSSMSGQAPPASGVYAQRNVYTGPGGANWQYPPRK